MKEENDAFLRELMNDFKIEAREHHTAIVNNLLLLEKGGGVETVKNFIEVIYRETHSLKGSARAVNLTEIEKLCMSLESVFNKIKKGESRIIPPMFDLFYKTLDLVDHYIKRIDNPSLPAINIAPAIAAIDVFGGVKSNNITTPIENIREEQKQIEVSAFNENIIEAPKSSNEFKQQDSDTVRTDISKLDNIFRGAEEFVSVKTSSDYLRRRLDEILARVSTVRASIGNYDSISGKELSKLKREIKGAEQDLADFSSQYSDFNRTAGRKVDELLIAARTTLLSPFTSLLAIAPKIVRDLSKEFDKEIKFITEGERTEIDRRILEQLKDPMIHLLRNCADHGIETKAERVSSGKNIEGKISVKVTLDFERNVILTFEDDGKGINKAALINSAIKCGVIKNSEITTLSDDDIYNLMFASGVSTKGFITDISGRGIGMAVVAEKIEALGGKILVTSNEGKGTKFTITLPQTLSTFRGLHITCSGEDFIIPTTTVEKVTRILPDDIRIIESTRSIKIDGEVISLVYLSDVLNIKKRQKSSYESGYLNVLILNSNNKKCAFVIDDVFGETEGLIKDLGSQLPHVKNIYGATISGSGKVVIVLNSNELIINSSEYKSINDRPTFETDLGENSSTAKRVLIAEDSITIRSMLKNFVENAGYEVMVAVDGLEAFNLLKRNSFDLVVSDIEMPRMNGFELTQRIREDYDLKNLPVILVTALESKEDQKKGLDAGANAYIVKSSFEKSNLTDTIKRLI